MRPLQLRLSAMLLSAGLQTLIFPVAGPLPQWRAALAWVALVPWFAVLLAKSEGRRPVLALSSWSYLCGILWYAGHCYWVYDTMYLYGGMGKPMALFILLLFCLYLGLYHALFGALVGWLRKGHAPREVMAAALPLIWVAVELARARVTSFPWDLLGYSQVDNAALTWMAPWMGAYGIGFVVAAVNALIAVAIVRRDRLAGLAGAALAVLLAVGSFVLHTPVAPALQGAVLVQPNLSPTSGRAEDEDRLLQDLSARTMAAVRERPAVLLWPEAPTPFEVGEPRFNAGAGELASRASVPMLVGATSFELGIGRRPLIYNSAALFLPGTGYAGKYDKIHLVPFGEYTPYEELFSFASGLTQQVGRMDRGQTHAPLTVAEHRYGIFICYESIFADEVRELAAKGADVLVNLSDDGWYGDTSAPFQHLNMARMRAMENRRWVLRDTNSGITAAIDPYGRIRETAPRHQRLASLMHFSYAQELTFYTRHGDLFAYACAAWTTALLGWSIVAVWRASVH